MNKKQNEIMSTRDGFIAALDQSGGSTPKALKIYGISDDAYQNDEEMFSLVHELRTRIITSPAFTSDKIVGAILFKRTMNDKIDGKYTGEYLLDKGILPFIKVDEGLAYVDNGVQLMKDMPNLSSLLADANEKGMYGTKMRSNILDYNEEGIKEVVDQQFEIGKEIIAAGLVPIIEPEVNIHAKEKKKIEKYLEKEILKHLNQLDVNQKVMLKLTIPDEKNLYEDLINHEQVIRVIALSGGYSTKEANDKLKENNGLIASFSRALAQDLRVTQSDEEFNETLATAIDSIYDASVNKI